MKTIEENKRKKIEKLKIISELKSFSNLRKRYQNVNFENTKATINTDFSTVFNRCNGMCTSIKITGNSIRNSINITDLKF